MISKDLLSSKWVRFGVFLWLVVFPLIFIVIPVAEIFTGESDESYDFVWALLVWMLGPWAASIIVKYTRGNDNVKDTQSDK